MKKTILFGIALLSMLIYNVSINSHVAFASEHEGEGGSTLLYHIKKTEVVVTTSYACEGCDDIYQIRETTVTTECPGSGPSECTPGSTASEEGGPCCNIA